MSDKPDTNEDLPGRPGSEAGNEPGGGSGTPAHGSRRGTPMAAQPPGAAMLGDDDALDLTGQCLIAMPGMSDDRFAKAVVFLTSHSAEGAMGIIVNRQVVQPTFGMVLDELDIPKARGTQDLHDTVPIFEGGPVEQGRGFVVHSLDYKQPNTVQVGRRYGLTTTLEILRNIAGGGPPGRFLLALGYAGWGAGQLERELAENAWLTCGACDDVLFDVPADKRYAAALATLGVDPRLLSQTAGHA